MVDLTDAEWAAIDPLFPVPPFRKKHTGRLRRPDRDVLNGILWVAPYWCPMEGIHQAIPTVPDLPPQIPRMGAGSCVPEGPPCAREGACMAGQTRYGRVVHERHLRKRQKSGRKVGPTKRGKGSKIMAICDGNSIPVAVSVASASPPEAKLATPTFWERLIRETPAVMVMDRGYDSNPLRIC